MTIRRACCARHCLTARCTVRSCLSVANAGERDVFVFGQDLPANLDPHQILDLGMTGYALNTLTALGFRV